MPDKQFLDRAYGLTGTEETIGFYEDWAASYDEEVTRNGYVTPGRCAHALAEFVTSKDTPILDFGCGTGLSGAALVAEGFTTIDGTDLSAAMLERARTRGVYRKLWQGSIEAPLDIAPGSYPVIAAIGVIGAGAAPVETFDLIMERLGPGGIFVFSFNDHTLEDPVYEGRLNGWIDAGGADLLFKEYGPHLPARDMNATVYVMRKR